MALDLKPPSWFADWSENGTNITVPIASFPEMTAAEADATTGDIRKVMFAVCERLYAAWLALASADRPTGMTVQRYSSVDDATGVTTKQFILTFKTAVLTQDVISE